MWIDGFDRDIGNMPCPYVVLKDGSIAVEASLASGDTFTQVVARWDDEVPISLFHYKDLLRARDRSDGECDRLRERCGRLEASYSQALSTIEAMRLTLQGLADLPALPNAKDI